jgi:hypothetical protein
MRTKRYVNEGRVHCPQRGEVDIETCLCCIDVEDVFDGENGGAAAVVCKPGTVAKHRDERLAIRW